ncbi:MFS transporter [Rhodoferax sp.]|uniref:MFS transporter n=1 Tax=Rhodoferax sp. TaxID=50421 RepID=UPI00374D158C
MLLTQFVMNTSHFMTMSLLAVYMVGTLRFGAWEVATVMTTNLLAAQLLPFVFGLMADRYGFRLFMAAGLLLRALGLLGFAFGSGWLALSAMALVMGIGVAMYESSVYPFFSKQAKPIATRAFVLNNQMLNMGVVAGPLLSAVLLAYDIKLAFLVSSALFGCLGLWVFSQRAIDAGFTRGTVLAVSLQRVLRDRRFLFFLLAVVPWYFLFAQLYVSFPLYLGQIAGEAAVPKMFLVNGLVGLAFMVGTMVLMENSDARSVLPRVYAMATVFFFAAPVLSTAWWFLLFIGCYTVVETLILPAIETIVTEMAPDGSQSTFFGALSVASAIGGGLGYYTGSWCSLNLDARSMWTLFSGVGVLGCVLSVWFVRTQRAPALERV